MLLFLTSMFITLVHIFHPFVYLCHILGNHLISSVTGVCISALPFHGSITVSSFLDLYLSLTSHCTSSKVIHVNIYKGGETQMVTSVKIMSSREFTCLKDIFILSSLLNLLLGKKKKKKKESRRTLFLLRFLRSLA